MSEAEVQVVLGAAAAYSERGTEGVVEFPHPEIEWRTRADLLDSAAYRGREGYRHLMSRVEERGRDRGERGDLDRRHPRGEDRPRG